MKRLALVAFAVTFGTASASSAPVQVGTRGAPCGVVAGFGAVWVASYSGTIQRIDPTGNRVTRTIPVGRYVCSLAVGYGAIWAVRDNANELVRLDPRTLRIRRARVAEVPFDILVAAGSVWVTGHGDGTMRRIDPKRLRATATIAVPGEPSGLTFADGSVWISSGAHGTDLFRIDPATNGVTRVPVGEVGPGSFVRQTAGVWVVTSHDSVIRIDPATNAVVATLPVAGIPAKGAAQPDGTIWIASKQANTVTRIDPRSNAVIDVRGAGRGAYAVGYAFGSMWVTSFAGSDVWRFPTG